MAGGLLEGNGNWNTAGNWSDGAALPGDGDLASIPETQTNDIIGPTGANQDFDLATVHTHPGYLGSFGSSGSPVIIAAGLVLLQGAGPAFFESNLAGGSAFITDEVRVEAAFPTTRVEIGSNPADSPSTIARVNAFRGDVTLTGNIKFEADSVVVVGQMTGSEDARVKIVSTAATLADFIQTSGHSLVDNIVTRLTINTGTCVKDVSKAIIIDVYAGGILVYNHEASAGDVLKCRVHSGGVLDLTQNGHLKEFDETIRYRGATILSNTALHTLNLVDMDREG